MLGFDAIGRLSIGQLPAPLVSTTFLNAKASAMARLRGSGTQTSAMSARSGGASESRSSMALVGILSARGVAKLSARAPGGVVLKSVVATMLRARTAPGYILFARAAMMGSGLSDIHIEGKIVGDHRDPLLLNSGSQYGASYWRGRG